MILVFSEFFRSSILFSDFRVGGFPSMSSDLDYLFLFGDWKLCAETGPVDRFQNLLWSRKTFVDHMKVYNHSYIYMPAFSMKTGTEPSLRVYYTLSDVGANQTVLFANPNFLRSIGKFWKSRGIHAKRLSTGLFLVSAALGLCEEVAIYGFWPFSVNMHEQPISHHYYDNVLPFSGFHAMPEEFLQLWYLHKIGALRMQLDPCEDTSLPPTS
ncbi:hypothetical protein J1605_006597 [Eschrichtius robustus]|uniref:Alpha-N-acetylneuraminide alpha-2,8-sialyltransferase n=1 Tax=Eschrichtius robustus TaxID=9764 RepID=A0AB34GZT4_ESCRO|nr:hypothetical protein J1605_006597 [Eschrichtius robustus]